MLACARAKETRNISKSDRVYLIVVCTGMCTWKHENNRMERWWVGGGFGFWSRAFAKLHKIDNDYHSICIWIHFWTEPVEVTPLVNVMHTLRETWHKLSYTQNHFILQTNSIADERAADVWVYCIATLQPFVHGAAFAWIRCFCAEVQSGAFEIGKQVLLILRHRKCTLGISSQCSLDKRKRNRVEWNRTTKHTPLEPQFNHQIKCCIHTNNFVNSHCQRQSYSFYTSIALVGRIEWSSK